MFRIGGQQWDVVSRGWLGENTPWDRWSLINVGLKIHGIMGWERLWRQIQAGSPWKSREILESAYRKSTKSMESLESLSGKSRSPETPESPGRRSRKSVETPRYLCR